MANSADSGIAPDRFFQKSCLFATMLSDYHQNDRRFRMRIERWGVTAHESYVIYEGSQRPSLGS
jgi:hypothetical protein